MNLILIGYRGTGKSSVARSLAERLGWPLLDSDLVVEQRSGKSIAELFGTAGEEVFRDLESAVLRELVQSDGQVQSLGGGIVLRPENRQLLRGAGEIIWLRATPETIARRLAADPATASQRPNLTPGGGLPEILAVLAAREPLYQQCATLRVDTEDKDPAAVAEEILARLKLAP